MSDTVRPFADHKGYPITLIEGFKERKVSSEWIEDFDAFAKKQWEDFEYNIGDGETLGQVQRRNIEALQNVLTMYQGKTVVIGSHGL